METYTLDDIGRAICAAGLTLQDARAIGELLAASRWQLQGPTEPQIGREVAISQGGSNAADGWLTAGVQAAPEAEASATCGVCGSQTYIAGWCDVCPDPS